MSDGRADSPQESVARVALGIMKVPAIPQFCLLDGPYEHPFDLGLPWAKTVVDLQSKLAHSSWKAVRRDIEIQGMVNLQRGWKLVCSVPDEVAPDPTLFARKVLAVVARQPGQRSRRLRNRYFDSEGDLQQSLRVAPWELPGAPQLWSPSPRRLQ
jgi:hypothetical protein